MEGGLLSVVVRGWGLLSEVGEGLLSEGGEGLLSEGGEGVA